MILDIIAAKDRFIGKKSKKKKETSISEDGHTYRGNVSRTLFSFLVKLLLDLRVLNMKANKWTCGHMCEPAKPVNSR